MKDMLGKPGSVSGLMLRLGQCLFAAASIRVMFSAFGFTNYTAFCYLVAAMGLQLFWSLGLACLDIYALWVKRDLQNPVLVSLFVVGDWVTATLSLAAACSSAGIVVLYALDLNACNDKRRIACTELQISVTMAFLTWLLSVTSAHVMFWISASV